MTGLLAAAPAAAQMMPTDRTDPEHLGGLNNLYVTPQPKLPRTQNIRGQVVYRLPSNIAELAKIDTKLSRLCQRGAFTQQINGFFWARTPSQTYGVAFPGGNTLNDPQDKRTPGKVYLFDKPEALCTVWVADQGKLAPHYVGPPPGQ